MAKRAEIEIGLKDTISSQLAKIDQSLSSLSGKEAGLRSLLDVSDVTKNLETLKNQLAELERTYDQFNRRREIRRAVPAAPPVFSTFQRASGILSGGGSNIMSATGEVINEAGRGLGILGQIPLAGIAAAGLGGVMVLGNTLVSAYERVVKSTMDLASAFGRLGESASRNTEIINETFNRTKELSREFGVAAQEVNALRAEITENVTSPTVGIGITRRALQMQALYGVSASEIAQIGSLSARFGEGNALDFIVGGSQALGMQGRRVGDYGRATLQLFEQALSRGVIRGFSELTRIQNFFGSTEGVRGELWRGMFGAQRISQINEAFYGAHRLARPEDTYLYQAAGALTGFNYIETRRMLERGVSVDLLRSFNSVLDSYFTNRNDKLVAVAETFQTTLDTADDILKAFESGNWERARSYAVKDESKTIQSEQLEVLKTSQELLNEIAEAGKNLLPIKTFLVEKLAGMVDTVNDFINKRNADEKRTSFVLPTPSTPTARQFDMGVSELSDYYNSQEYKRSMEESKAFFSNLTNSFMRFMETVADKLGVDVIINGTTKAKR